MRPEDKTEFSNLLIAAMAVYERQITRAVADLYFNALGQFTLAQVREGLGRHMQDPEAGKFSPKPADVIQQIAGSKSDDGRPGKDEAWSIALCSLDESDTVVATEEILAALTIARPLLEIRDKVAARMAFIEAYERHVAQARREGRPAKWIVSLGDDKGRRIHAVQEGLRLGRLTDVQAQPHLARIAQETQPISLMGSAIAGLLGGPKNVTPLTPAEFRQRLSQVREQIRSAPYARAEKFHAEAVARRDDLLARKQEAEKAISEISTDGCELE